MFLPCRVSIFIGQKDMAEARVSNSCLLTSMAGGLWFKSCENTACLTLYIPETPKRIL